MNEALLTPSVPTPARVGRADGDYYPTPSWCVDAILPHLPLAHCALDPACGVGELLGHRFERTVGIEIDAERANKAASVLDESIFADALDLHPWPNADLLIANPPFSHALEFAERAITWRLENERRTVAMLLRLTFLESRERKSLHRVHPADVYVLSERPKFRPGKDGKMATDSVTCAWFVWGPARGGGRWCVL